MDLREIDFKQASSLYARKARGLVFNLYTCEENRFIWRAENDSIIIGVSQDQWTPKLYMELSFEAPKTLKELRDIFNLSMVDKLELKKIGYDSLERAIDDIAKQKESRKGRR